MRNKFLRDVEFEDKKINKLLNKVDENLKDYINNNILDEYQLNDDGHNLSHINYVLKRAFELVDEELNYNILYTCVMFHDIACHIDREEHEILSAQKAYEDKFLNTIFDKAEMSIIKDAITDHRASLEYAPRNLYGKILSTADRKVEIKQYLIASMSFNIKKGLTKEEVINDSYNFAIKKFGEVGYAIHKTYINDPKYKKFLKDIQYLINNKVEYIELATIVYDDIITPRAGA